MSITPEIGAVLITHNNYRWLYIGNLQWRCIGNNANMYTNNWQIGDIFTDQSHPLKLKKGERYITFKSYLKLL